MSGETPFLIVGGAIVALVVLSSAASSVIYVATPTEVLVFTGPFGTRIVGKRGWKWPLVERAQRLDLTAVPIEAKVERVRATAFVRIANDPDTLPLAVTRYLGKKLQVVGDAGTRVLEGHLRRVMKGSGGAEAMARDLERSARSDMAAVGLAVDSVKLRVE